MTLDGLTFDNFFFYQFVVGFVTFKASVCPRIFDVVVMHVVVKGSLNPHDRAQNELCTLKGYYIDRYPKLGIMWIDRSI